eukprot:3335428-Alexandrium_andersonii.AAC.1
MLPGPPSVLSSALVIYTIDRAIAAALARPVSESCRSRRASVVVAPPTRTVTGMACPIATTIALASPPPAQPARGSAGGPHVWQAAGVHVFRTAEFC